MRERNSGMIALSGVLFERVRTMSAFTSKRWPTLVLIVFALVAIPFHNAWVSAAVFLGLALIWACVLRFVFSWPWRRIANYREGD